MPPNGENTAKIKVVPNPAALNLEAAEEIVRCARRAVAATGRFCVALSGGSTPRGVYSLLAEKEKEALPWDKVCVFFGDERNVPPDHPDSNYRMARESLLAKVPIPPANIFPVAAELPAEIAAAQYEEAIRTFFRLGRNDWPRFDLILLGLGEDGHTASLFPGSPALGERLRIVVSNRVEKFHNERITFTYPTLNHALKVLFLVSGPGKARILRDVFNPAGQGRYPAQAVQPENGAVVWMADQDAAGLLGRN